MDIIGGHLPEVLVMLVIVAAIIALILVGIGRFHQYLHRRI
jgi:hypothetical protein